MTDSKKEAFTAFSDVDLGEIRRLLKVKSLPILVLEQEARVVGILDEAGLLKGVAERGWEGPLENLLNRGLSLLQSRRELNTLDPDRHDYFVLKEGAAYRIYSALEVRSLQCSRKAESLQNINASLQEEMEKARKKNQELREILNSSYDEIYVTDAEGNTLFVSKSCEKFTGLPAEAFIGKNVRELDEKGILQESVTLKVLKTRKVESVQQAYPNGKTVLATAKPIFDAEGRLHRIVTNSRDVTELVELRNQLQNAKLNNGEEARRTRNRIASYFSDQLITRSEKMLPIIDLVEKVAPIDSSILMQGESGVGKGVLARVIHDLSPRKGRPFVQVNCGAIPANLIESELFGHEAGAFTGAGKRGKAGLVEEADGGTLFLDEIGELPLELQVKLLHLVQEKSFKRVGGAEQKTVDIRIIAATNKDLKKMVEERLFREDLYYRLHVVPMHIPSLRERDEDILPLAEHFLARFNKKYSRTVSLDERALTALQDYSWPGNIRELENLIEQLVVTAKGAVVSLDELPYHIQGVGNRSRVKVSGIMPIKEAVEEAEKQVLSYAVTRYKTTRKIARALEVNQTTIMRKLHKYQLNGGVEES